MGLKWAEPSKTYSREGEKDYKSAWERKRKKQIGNGERGRVRERQHCMPQWWDPWRFCCLSSKLVSLWTRTSKLIMSSAYLPFSPPQSNKHTKSNWKMGNAQQQKSDTSGSTALRHSLCFHYHILSRTPGESADGAVDYPTCMGCRVWSMKDTDRVGRGRESGPQGLK